MGFLDALRNVAGRVGGSGLAGDRDSDGRRLFDSIDDGGSAHPEFPGKVPAADLDALAAPPDVSKYDLSQWRKKLGRIVEHLPESERDWADLEQEAGAFLIAPSELARVYRDEFTMLVRRIVSDRVVTPAEHRKLDIARTLMGISEADAEEILHAIVAEAESFFGKKIDGA